MTTTTKHQSGGLVASPLVERTYRSAEASGAPWIIYGPIAAGRFILALIWCGIARPVLRACAARPSLITGVIAVGVGVAYWFWVTVIGLILAPFALTALIGGLYLIQYHAVERRIEKRFLAAGWQPRPPINPTLIPTPTGDNHVDVAALRAHLATHYGTEPTPKPRWRRIRQGRLIPSVIIITAIAWSFTTIAYRIGTP